mmetsp:Transcript_1188/g.2384  ORF Transcript_1188/g.2384 Transcript_1188/m.2384 type:complete len:219 (-) Transcript_1188:126-782(-)
MRSIRARVSLSMSARLDAYGGCTDDGTEDGGAGWCSCCGRVAKGCATACDGRVETGGCGNAEATAAILCACGRAYSGLAYNADEPTLLRCATSILPNSASMKLTTFGPKKGGHVATSFCRRVRTSVLHAPYTRGISSCTRAPNRSRYGFVTFFKIESRRYTSGSFLSGGLLRMRESSTNAITGHTALFSSAMRVSALMSSFELNVSCPRNTSYSFATR